MPGICTVTTPPAFTRLASLGDAKAELGITDATQDAVVARLLDRASAVIAGYCGRAFGLQTVAETFRFGWEPGVGPASQTALPYGTPINIQRKPLILSMLDVRAISSIVELGAQLDPASDYEADPGAGLVFRLRSGLRSWWNGPTVIVSYSAGWNLPDDPVQIYPLPADVADACLALARSGWYARGRDPNVALDWTDGLGRTQYWDRSITGMALDDVLKAQLAGYARRAW